MSAHDRWLANYRHTVVDAWCENPKCEHGQPEGSFSVDYEEEYGAGWTQPEECPICHSGLTLEPPKEGEA